MSSALKSSGVNGRKSRSGPIFAPSTPQTLSRLTVSRVETRARSTAERVRMVIAGTPTYPDTSLPWSDDCDLGGWSAKMFLHQLLAISRSPWTPSDTTRLLSASKARVLRANLGSGISLSAIVKTECSPVCFRTSRMVQGLIRRALARGRSLRLLLRTERDTIPVIVTFGIRAKDCESWTLQSAKPLRDSLRDGLLDYLRQHAPGCTETPPSPK
jgi:hypothetical protein